MQRALEAWLHLAHDRKVQQRPIDSSDWTHLHVLTAGCRRRKVREYLPRPCDAGKVWAIRMQGRYGRRGEAAPVVAAVARLRIDRHVRAGSRRASDEALESDRSEAPGRVDGLCVIHGTVLNFVRFVPTCLSKSSSFSSGNRTAIKKGRASHLDDA